MKTVIKGRKVPEFIILGGHDLCGLGEIDRFAGPYTAFGFLQPDEQLIDDTMELLVGHQRHLQLFLPVCSHAAHLVPPRVRKGQSVPQLSRSAHILRVVGQMSTDGVQADQDASMAVPVQHELPVIVYNVLQLLDVTRWRILLALGAFRELQPHLQPPEVVLQLSPVATRAQGTGQPSVVAVTNEILHFLFSGSSYAKFDPLRANVTIHAEQF